MASDAIREFSFDELARRLGANGRRLPLDGTLETTFRCNLAWVHCYVNQPAGIRRLVARGVRLGLKNMALRWNQHEIMAMRDFAHGLGLEFRFDGLLNARVDCGASRHGEMQLSAEQLVALDLGDARRADGLKSFCDRFVSRPDDVGESERVFLCGAGQSSFTVDPYGRLQRSHTCRPSRSWATGH